MKRSNMPRCAVESCATYIQPPKVFCSLHWAKIPDPLKERLSAAFWERRKARLLAFETKLPSAEASYKDRCNEYLLVTGEVLEAIKKQ